VNICVYGAGAVGGSIAARLSASGENVSVIARGAHLDAIRQRGLAVLTGDSRIDARVRCTSDPAELAPQDLVVVTVKGQQLPAIAAPLGKMLERGAHAVFAMNGILWWFTDGLRLCVTPKFAESLDPGGALRRCIPPERIVGAVVNSSNEIIEPGVILNTSPDRNRLTLGAAHGASAAAVDAIAKIAAAFTRAGYEAPVTPNIRQALWNKLALYVGVAPMAALTHCALDRLVGDAAAYAMMAGLIRETITIGERLGFEHAGDVDSQLDFFGNKPTRPSMLQDFELGREPELAGTILAVEAIAQALNVDAPRIGMAATMLRLKAANLRR
jgi:2-dehydropantoate 2-reductase